MTELELILVGALIALAVINSLALIKQRFGTIGRAHEGANRVEQERGVEVGSIHPPNREQILGLRARLRHEFEEERGSKVITIIHRREPWTKSTEEDPEIVLEDAESVVGEIRKTSPDTPIDLIIHTPGGLAAASQLIAMAVKFHPAKVTVFVPFYAWSGGTLVALAADEIRMEKYSILGPVDPQIDGFPASLYSKILKRKSQDSITDKTLILAELAELEIRNVMEFVKWLLLDRMDGHKASQVAEVLVGGYMSHDSLITMEPAKRLGLNVVEGIPKKIYEMFETYDFNFPKKIGLHEYP